MPVERYEILGGEVARNGYRQREYKGIPIGSKGLAWIADVRDARYIGGKDAHAHHPTRNRVACGGELFSTAAFLEERTAEHDDAQCKSNKDDEINQMHSLPFLMGSASSAACIFSLSGASNL